MLAKNFCKQHFAEDTLSTDSHAMILPELFPA